MSVVDRLEGERGAALQLLMTGVRERARRRGDRVLLQAGGVWIALRSRRAGRIFAELRPGREGFQLFLLPPREALRDPRGYARPAPPSQGWGWFRTKATVPWRETAGAVPLLAQSLDAAYDRALSQEEPRRRK